MTQSPRCGAAGLGLNLALPLTDCVTLDELFNPSVLRFLICKLGFLITLVRDVMRIK